MGRELVEVDGTGYYVLAVYATIHADSQDACEFCGEPTWTLRVVVDIDEICEDPEGCRAVTDPVLHGRIVKAAELQLREYWHPKCLWAEVY